MIDEKEFVSTIKSIQKLDEKGQLDPSALKAILMEHLSETISSFNKIEFVQKIFDFLLDAMVAKNLITEEEKNDWINQLEIKYGKNEDKINQNIILNKSSYSEAEIKNIISNSYFKGIFTTYDELCNTYPINKSSHGWRALVIPDSKKVTARKVNDVKEYVFDIRKRTWTLTQDKTLLRNTMERIDTTVSGREKGSPLEGDFITYQKDKERWMPYTKDELDIASRVLQQFHLSSILSNKIVHDRLVPNTKEYIEKERLSRLNKDNDYYKNLAKDDYNISYESYKEILDQINKDYTKIIQVDYPLDKKLGHKRPKLYRNVSTKTHDGRFKEDYDDFGLVRKNISNPTIEKIFKYINNDFYREILIKNKNERIINVLGETTETTADKDLLVPRNISKQQLNLIITQINKDYFNVINHFNYEAYDNYLSRYLENNITNKNERLAIAKRLKANKNVFADYVVNRDYKENTKNKTIQMDILNKLTRKINELEIKLDIARDEIFERVNTYNADKTFSGNISINKNLKIILDALIHGNLKVLKNVVIGGNLEVQGDEIYFSKIKALTKIQSENTIMRDKIIEINKPGEDKDLKSDIYKKWVEKLGNGVSGFRTFRGTKLQDFFIGYDESRKSLVCGFIDQETEDYIKTHTYKIALRDNDLKDKKPIRYNINTDRLETTDELNADINGCNYKEFIVHKDKIDKDIKLYSPVRIDSNGVFKKSKTINLKSADVLGLVRKIESYNNNQILLQVVFNGPMNIVLPSTSVGKTVFVNESGNLVTSINKSDSEDYIIKEVARVIDINTIMVNPIVSAKYMKANYDDPSANADYSAEKIILDSYFIPNQFSKLKPVGATSKKYEIFSIAKHGVNGLKGLMIKNSSGNIILADNGTLVNIKNAFSYDVDLNEKIYLTSENTLTIETTDIKVGEIVGVNLMRINIEEKHIVKNTIKAKTIVNRTQLNKDKLLSGTIYKIDIEDNMVEEITFMQNGTANFNKLYIVKSGGKVFLKDIIHSKTFGIFYITASEELYYKPVIDQNSVFKNTIMEAPNFNPSTANQMITK